MVVVRNLVVRINNQLLINDISCTLEPKRITSFIGKSGAGKTTLLKALVGLIPITEGEITIHSRPINALTQQQKAKEIGYVFQDFNLFAHYTVWQNCIDPLLVFGVAYDAAERTVKAVLQQLDMYEHKDKLPRQLSGGQQQRTAIARALCLNPSVLLLDEPTASLDPSNTDILVSILCELAQSGLTIGVSSQDMRFIAKIFDHVYYLEAGRVVEFCNSIDQLSMCANIKDFMQLEF